MMGDRPVQEPAELVIWGATALLGVVLGVGLAFTLWTQLHHTAEPALLNVSVMTLAAGGSLVALAFRSLATRLFLLTLSATLVLAFFLGGSAFAAIAV